MSREIKQPRNVMKGEKLVFTKCPNIIDDNHNAPWRGLGPVNRIDKVRTI